MKVAKDHCFSLNVTPEEIVAAAHGLNREYPFRYVMGMDRRSTLLTLVDSSEGVRIRRFDMRVLMVTDFLLVTNQVTGDKEWVAYAWRTIPKNSESAKLDFSTFTFLSAIYLAANGDKAHAAVPLTALTLPSWEETPVKQFLRLTLLAHLHTSVAIQKLPSDFTEDMLTRVGTYPTM